jgi:bacterial/archaeal transporter family protein
MSADYRLLLLSGLTILMWGLWGFFGKLALERKMAPASIFLAEVLISAVCAVPVMVVLWRRQDALAGSSSLNIFGLLSGAGLAFGLLFYYFALEKSQAAIVVPLTAVYPVVTVLLSYIVLRERLSFSQWLGVFMVVAGAFLLLYAPAEKVSPK